MQRLLYRRFSVSSSLLSSPARVCIVGTGPGGFYAAKYLIKENPSILVDLIDSLPTPFGLVRSGVAPDHQDVKSVQNDFSAVATDPRVRFLGGVMLGRDLSIEELSRHYNAVVLAYGAASDRQLGVEGEGLDNVFSARAFVAWYNGHPDFATWRPNLDAEDVVIVGQGNVAIDCARILCKTGEELADSDIAAHAAEALAKSKVKRVHLIGRRGHVQASFTMKELREVTRLKDAACVLSLGELERGRTAASKAEIETHRAKKRMDALYVEEMAKRREEAGNHINCTCTVESDRLTDLAMSVRRRELEIPCHQAYLDSRREERAARGLFLWCNCPKVELCECKRVELAIAAGRSFTGGAHDWEARPCACKTVV